MGLSRRRFLHALSAAPLALPGFQSAALAIPRPTDIRIAEVLHGYEDFVYRAPYKFGGRVVDRVTLLNVRCRVTTRNGKSAWGFGSMTMGNMWAFPSKTMPYDTTLDAMKALAERIARITTDCKEVGHPLDLAHVLEPEYLKAAADVSSSRKLDDAIPKLCTLVVASPFDAAIHDGFGKVHGRNVYATYGPDLMTHDLARYLGPQFKGERLDHALLARPQARIPLFHSVGGLDPLEATDVEKPLRDGLPETLPEWIRRNGLVRIKIKLSGEDLEWDIRRTLAIDRVAAEAQSQRGVNDWSYCLDFNERCPNVEYVLECLRRIRAGAPAGFRRILYVEQPTARDLQANRANVMHEAAKLRPVVIDESLTDLESLLLARDMGYNGVALKACKGQSHAMLMAAAARKYKMFLCVQDLTCPGASLVHSVGISAHVPAVAGIEANARQYVPAANQPWEARFPGIFTIADGYMRTAEIRGPGLGIPEEMASRVALVPSGSIVGGRATLVIGTGLLEPFGVDFDSAGNTYIVEMSGNRVSVLEKGGRLRVLAGTGEKGFGGDGGPGPNAQFNGPHHLLFGPDGHLYLADTWNNCVRKIDVRTGVVTRVAGTGQKGFSGDGGPARDAQFGGIYAIAFRGNVLYACDLDNRRVRAVDLATGIVATVAGNGEKGVPRDGEDARSQPLVDPRAVALDSAGNLYICERGGHALRVVDVAGRIRTVAGTGQAGFSGDGGPALDARVNGPKHISVEPGGAVLICDTENHVIRRYSPGDGRIRRVAGTGLKGAAGLDGPAERCELNRPHGAIVHPATGAIYISDSDNHRVIRVEG